MGNLLPAQLLPEAGAPLYHKLSFSKSTLPTAILNSKKQKIRDQISNGRRQHRHRLKSDHINENNLNEPIRKTRRNSPLFG